MRRLIQIYLLAALVFMLPAAVQAQFNYAFNPDNTVIITDYTGSGGLVNIPNIIAELESQPLRDNP